MKYIQSYATRPKRHDDDDEMPDHIFINKEDMEFFNKEDMIAYTRIGENEYFATVDQMYKNDFYIIDPDGLAGLIKNVSEKYHDINLVPIYVDCDASIMLSRAMERRQNISEWLKRYNDEDARFSLFEEDIMEDEVKCYVVDNSGKFIDSLEALHAIVKRESNED